MCAVIRHVVIKKGGMKPQQLHLLSSLARFCLQGPKQEAMGAYSQRQVTKMMFSLRHLTEDMTIAS